MNSAEVLEKQKQFFRGGTTKDLSWRKEQLHKLRGCITDNQQQVVEALALDLGKPELESLSSEVGYLIKEIDHTLSQLRHWARGKSFLPPFVLLPGKSRIIKEPRGSVLVLSPWNYPFQLALAPVIAALAAGNTVILKPSEISRHTQDILAKLINGAFSEDVFCVITGGAEVSKTLTSLPFDFIFFTGSTATGRHVMRAASENLTPVCLELGGKSPCIIDKNVDMDVAVRRVVWGKFFNAGQTCVAPDYVYVHQNVAADFKKRLFECLKDFYGERPKESADYARIINKDHFQRLKGLIDPAKIIHGGEATEAELFIEPTVLDGVTWNDPIMQEEIFGPLLPILEFSNGDDVIESIQGRGKPLAFYIFTTNKEFSEKVVNAVSFGGGCVNDTLVHLVDLKLPFGGVGESGMGAYHGQYGFDLFSHNKSLIEKSNFLDFRFRYPPYTEKKSKLFKRFLA